MTKDLALDISCMLSTEFCPVCSGDNGVLLPFCTISVTVTLTQVCVK